MSKALKFNLSNTLLKKATQNNIQLSGDFVYMSREVWEAKKELERKLNGQISWSG
jgi:hypothetical protein